MAHAFKVNFNWSGPDLDKAAFKSVSCDGQNIPGDKLGGASVGDWVMQNIEGEQLSACLTTNKTQVLAAQPGRFLYMDVGCWLKGHQSFGVICGNDALVCDYTPSSPKGGANASTGDLLKDFLNLDGITVAFDDNEIPLEKKILGKFPGRRNRLYVILPDMHVPASPPLSYARPTDPSHTFNDDTYGSWAEDPRAFDEVCARDYFDSRRSIAAAVQFLNMLQGLPWASQITLIQLGDLYELWASRDCYFKARTDGNAGVIATDAKEVGGWVAETHYFYRDLFLSIDGCVSTMKTYFLHGNHDNYLSDPAVVKAANAALVTEHEQSLDPNAFNALGEPNPQVPLTKVHPRVEGGNIFAEGIFIEHGQRVDVANHDGATAGLDGCNKAVKHRSIWGAFDCVRRETFVTGAAAEWVIRGGKGGDDLFGLYVMGHTHQAELKYVEVTHQRADIGYVYRGRALVRIVIKKPMPAQ